MARSLVLLGALALVALMAFLTASLAVDEGLSARVAFSIVILAVLGFGVLGALTARDDE